MKSKRKNDWLMITDEELLKTKICDLDLSLTGSRIALYIERIYTELSSKKIFFRPHVWVSTEWFSPYGVAGFAIPFYLLHPRLIALEKFYLGEAEGATEKYCLRLIRHEIGHAIDNAFHLRKSKTRQRLFGLSGTPYPKSYLPQPGNRNFVRYLKNDYAQSHPDEDWAETFAVWLDPTSDWQKRYSGAAAQEKLAVVDELMRKIMGEIPVYGSSEPVEGIENCSLTLAEYFKHKQKRFRIQKVKNLPGALRVLASRNKVKTLIPASHYLGLHRNELCQQIAKKTKIAQYKVMQSFDDIIVSTASQPHLFFNVLSKQNSERLVQGLATYLKGRALSKSQRIIM